MTAKEMFEKLGYTQEIIENKSKTRNLKIVYYQEPTKDKRQAYCFDLIFESYYTTSYDELFKKVEKGTIFGVTAEEVKAIHQQMRELGWIKC